MRATYFPALAIAVAAILWMVSGLLVGDDERSAKSLQDSAGQVETGRPLQDVRVRTVVAAPFVNDVVVSGRSQPSRAVEIRGEATGLVEEILAAEGDHVAQGDVLVRLEERGRAARVREAKELVAQREVEYNAAQQLETQGYNTRIRLAEASASLEAARAGLRQAEIDLEKTQIVAPFEGVLGDQFVESGDYVTEGTPLFTVVDLNPVEFAGYVTERHVGSIDVGQSAKIVFLDGHETEGVVTFVAPEANPDTRTFRVLVSVDNPDGLIRGGLTVELRLPLAERMAHRISPSVLSLNDEGVVGVKLVGDSDEVQFVPVAILADRPGFMLVGGLPEKVRLITVGQEFVIDGQKVNPVLAEGDGPL